ncbi:ferric uptake regulation protein [Campylobacterota bacterium]|nr:ferric uptake regulation protein [Campylobacterota bacterium]
MSEDFEELLVRLSAKLRNRGHKMTAQREAILREIFNAGHFTPEALRDLVAKRYPKRKIGLATIYRTLNILEDEKIVTSVSFGVSGKRYEFGIKDHHDHMICDICGEMIEFVDEQIEKRQKLIAKQHNFRIVSHTMQIRGVCAKCQEL